MLEWGAKRVVSVVRPKTAVSGSRFSACLRFAKARIERVQELLHKSDCDDVLLIAPCQFVIYHANDGHGGTRL